MQPDFAIDFASTDGTITCNGTRVHIKGANWFGLETDTYSLHGLWAVSFDSVLGFISDNKFNALRIPLSVELVEKLKTDKIKSISGSANPGLVDMTIETFLDHVFKKCAERGILVMLDMHLLKASSSIPELWYSSEFPEKRSIDAWETLVRRYQKHWNFFACDLKNEPHGAATWGDASATDWCAAAGRIGNAILKLCPRMLIFVEGIDGTHNNEDSWWGGYLGLAGADKHPVSLSKPNRLVYSPHVYGPDVFAKESFKEASFPGNMKEYWGRQWAFLKKDTKGAAVCLGEWGGKAQPGSPDLLWQRALAEYLAANDITDSFYWCINPESGDTGGLLTDDWKTPVAAKLQIIATACPAPSTFLGGKPYTPSPDPPQPSPSPYKEDIINPNEPDASFDPASITVAATIAHSWKASGVEHQQRDVVLKNTNKFPVGSRLQVKIGGAKVVQIWNVDNNGGGAYKLPAWLLTNGGLQPGASVSFGCITTSKPPAFQILCKAVV